jgi:putative hydrolases of HD superfamily
MEATSKRETELTQILRFLDIAERLKFELRHSWLSNGRQESVAEHTWRVSLMLVLLAPMLEQPIDVLKYLKMAIIHDIAEAEAGDIPVFNYASEQGIRDRFAVESAALNKILAQVPSEIRDELRSLWVEFEEQSTFGAKVVKALDKLEVQVQHNEAMLGSWEHHEKLMVFQPRWMTSYCQVDPALCVLGDLVRREAENKLAAEGEDTLSLNAEAASVI